MSKWRIRLVLQHILCSLYKSKLSRHLNTLTRTRQQNLYRLKKAPLREGPKYTNPANGILTNSIPFLLQKKPRSMFYHIWRRISSTSKCGSGENENEIEILTRCWLVGDKNVRDFLKLVTKSTFNIQYIIRVTEDHIKSFLNIKKDDIQQLGAVHVYHLFQYSHCSSGYYEFIIPYSHSENI